MQHRQRRTLLALLLTLLLVSISGCVRLVPESESVDEISIYASFYPLYALTELIVRDVPGIQAHCPMPKHPKWIIDLFYASKSAAMVSYKRSHRSHSAVKVAFCFAQIVCASARSEK